MHIEDALFGVGVVSLAYQQWMPGICLIITSGSSTEHRN
jgi:hypothetical protein